MTPLEARSARTIFMTPTDSADLEMIKAVVDAIGDRAVGEDRRKAPAARFEQRIGAAHIEEAFVLAGKTGIGQVFRRRRAAHRDGNLAAIVIGKLAVGLADQGAQIVLGRRRVNDAARLRGAFLQQIDVGLVEPVQKIVKLVPGVRRGQRVAIGLGGEREAVRHPDALRRENRIKLAERGVLAADQSNIVQPGISEPAHIVQLRQARVRHWGDPWAQEMPMYPAGRGGL